MSNAAATGYAESQHNLGTMYYLGNGVTQDYQQAFNWYSKAKEQGYVHRMIFHVNLLTVRLILSWRAFKTIMFR